MAGAQSIRTPRVNLTKYVQVRDGEWRFCPVLTSANGRLKPNYVIVGERPELHQEGYYSLDWYENGKRKRRSVGNNPIDAYAAQERQRQLLAAKAHGIAVEDDTDRKRGLTLSVACADFLDEIKVQRRPKTFHQYRVALRYFEEFCGDIALSAAADRKQLLKFLHFMLQRKELSRRTSWTKLNVVVQMLKAHGHKGVLKRGDWPRYTQREPEIFPQSDLDQFFATCNPGERLLFEFFLTTGFRDSEVQHVFRSDVDLKNGIVKVTEKPSFGFIPKDWEHREVPVPRWMIEALERPVRQKNSSPLLFPTSGGKPNQHFLDQCKAIAYKAGLNCGNCEGSLGKCSETPSCRNWHLHKFRATFATMHLQAGIDIRTVQDWMGHKDLASTMRYLKPARGKGIAERVNATFRRSA
jgi:integrase/recombinase XerD